MTTPVYTVNSSITCYGVRAGWQRVEKRRNSDGTTDFQPWALHTWDIAQMEMTTFESLRALQGAALASLATNDIIDRNDNATYTSAVLGLVNGQQIGRRAVNVRLEFRVDV